MSVFDQWSKYIAEVLKAESKLAGELAKRPVEFGDAREALIKLALSRILPTIYEIGRGEIIDSKGQRSNQIDIVISRRDIPSLSLPSGSKVYLVESVLATIEVKSTLNIDTLKESLNNCASVGKLNPEVIGGSREKLAKDMGVVVKDNRYQHDDIVQYQRFTLYGRPACYVFGFKGYVSASVGEFVKAIHHWGNDRLTKNIPVEMRDIPAVIASEGCYALRIAEPYYDPTVPNPGKCLAFAGADDTPLRLLIAHLLYTLQSKIPWVAEAKGIIPNPHVYLQQMRGFDQTNTLFCALPPEAENRVDDQQRTSS